MTSSKSAVSVAIGFLMLTLGNRKRLAALMLGTVIGASGIAHARTWYVERDGSGEFTVIQDAVDAAANGDTIRIGPGRYDDWGEVHAPAWTEQTIVWVNKDNLVFIGAGADVTRIGPEVYYSPPGDLPKVICCVDNYGFLLEGITIENCREGVYAYGRLEMSSCSVINYEYGIVGFTDNGLVIDNTTFFSDRGLTRAVATYSPAQNVLLSRCRFAGNGHGVSFSGVTNVQIWDNIFGCERTNIKFSDSIGVVERCVVEGDVAQGVIIGENSEVQLFDSEFYGRIDALEVRSGSIVDATGCIFLGGSSNPTIYAYATSQMNIHGCHILNGGNYSVKLAYFFYQPIEQDLTGNYWGTTDTAQIDAWIWDQQDDPAIHSVVNYLPIADGPVQTERTTWGAVKTLFRNATR